MCAQTALLAFSTSLPGAHRRAAPLAPFSLSFCPRHSQCRYFRFCFTYLPNFKIWRRLFERDYAYLVTNAFILDFDFDPDTDDQSQASVVSSAAAASSVAPPNGADGAASTGNAEVLPARRINRPLRAATSPSPRTPG